VFDRDVGCHIGDGGRTVQAHFDQDLWLGIELTVRSSVGE
jgi:hypothetical protein